MPKTVTVIPAQPGYIALRRQDGLLLKGDAIIAWVVTAESDSDPRELAISTFVQAVPIDPSVQHDAILHPDGRVTEPGNVVYESLEDASAAFMERHQKGYDF